tara:strand:+ start:1545 stop:3353 length:1809 start_codon:yes stop_codon:yes gene_type:complete
MSALEPALILLGSPLKLDCHHQVVDPFVEQGWQSKYSQAVVAVEWLHFSYQISDLAKQLKDLPVPVIHCVRAGEEEHFWQSFQYLPIFQMIGVWDSKVVEEAFYQANLCLQEDLQQEDLIAILNEQVEKQDLERVLLDSELQSEKGKTAALLHKKEFLEKRTEATRRLLVAILQANNLKDLEKRMQESLAPYFALDLVQIRTAGAYDAMESSYEYRFDVREYGEVAIHYIREKDFLSVEKKYLEEISAIIEVLIVRFLQESQTAAWLDTWKKTFEAFPVDIIVVDEDRNLLLSNKQKTGKKCYAALFGQEQACEGCHLEKDFYLQNYDKKSDQMQYFEVNSNTLYLDDNKKNYVHTYYPVTEKYLYGQSRMESMMLKDLGIIGSSIAHDLNNPISGMHSLLQILLSEAPEKSEVYEVLKDMLEATEEAKMKVKNLLDFSRQDVAIDKQGSKLKDNFKKVMALLSPELHKASVQLHMPEILEDPLLEISENAFSQVILEIFRNSLEAFTEAATQTPKIQVCMEVTADQVIIEITDNGPGMDQKSQLQVFNPLFTTKNPSFHKGLGLTTCYHILERCQSKIEVLPAKTEGLRVRLSLARKKPPA